MWKRILLLLPALPALLSAADPYVGYLYPAGAQAGTTVQILAGGQNLNGLQGGVVSGTGVAVRSVKLVPGFPPPEWTQRKYLLEWIRNIEEGNRILPKLPEKTDTWRKNAWWDKLDKLEPLELNLVIRDLYIRRNPLQATPSLRQMAIIEVHVTSGAAPGIRELRLWSRSGVSAPKLFYVDPAPHTAEPLYVPPDRPQPETPRIDRFPAVLDGQIMPGETDRFRLALKAGKPYTLTAAGRKFQPFIGDAVPGHFQPVLRLLGPDGEEAAFADDDHFNPDPVMRFRPEKDGEYTLEVRDNLYRGREDFVYRVAVEPREIPYSLADEPFPKLPRVKADAARRQPLLTGEPQVIDGTISRPGERAAFRFYAKAGSRIVIDVAARRFGSPLDGVLRVTRPDGTVLAEADDSPSELNIGECLQQVDPYLSLQIPADGTYTVELRDLTGAAGADYRYLMRIGPPVPDFLVYASKSMLNLYAAQTGKLKLHVVRQDGFDGKITLSSDDLLLPAQNTVPPGADEFTVSVKNPAKKNTKPIPVVLNAEAQINGRTFRKPVIPCDEFIQAFAYTHLLPARELYLGTIYSNPPRKKAAADK
ncbi:MAG: hypothetical protein HPZ91_03330 [Lentisphaeria bacterium]|nr:hypothetical protein [Lentisphaeria bacterium]